jgi:uncharacterized protein YkwD
MVTVVLLALGALGVATPALLPNADAAPMDTSTQATTVRTPPLLLPEDPEPTESTVPTPSPSDDLPDPAPTDSPAPTDTAGVEPSAPVETEQPTPDSPADADRAMEKRVYTLVNQRRAKVGCPGVKYNAALYNAAFRHSNDMARKDYFSHTGADGSTPWKRAERAGYKKASAENLAAGQRTAAEVVKAWMDSKAHRAILLDCDHTVMGVALARGGSYGIYWTQMFGDR